MNPLQRFRLSVCLFSIVACLSLSPASAQANHICWISQVKKTWSNGVDVYFSDSRDVVLFHSGIVLNFFINAKPAQSPAPVHAVTVPALPAEVGDEIFAHNGPEDSCSMKVVSRDGKIGVEAQSAFHPPIQLPGGKSVGGVTTDFIPAE